MSKPTRILSPEEIERSKAATKAATERLREAVAGLREENQRLGLPAEELQQMYDSALPGTREWIDQAVKAGRQRLAAIASGPSQAAGRPRKRRVMV